MTSINPSEYSDVILEINNNQIETNNNFSHRHPICYACFAGIIFLIFTLIIWFLWGLLMTLII